MPVSEHGIQEGTSASCLSSRTREIALEILYRGPRVGHGAITAISQKCRTRTLRVAEPAKGRGRHVSERHASAGGREESNSREFKALWQPGNGDGPTICKRTQRTHALLRSGVVVDVDIEGSISLAVHGDAALKYIFPGTIQRVVVHGGRVVGKIERPILDCHMELI